jgi:hypothetical protein
MDTSFLVFLCWLTGCPSQQGVASVYWPGDGHCGTVKADGREFDKTDFHLASRTLPLHERVLVCNKDNGVCVEAPVKDRGPYGFCRPRKGVAKIADTRQCPAGYSYKVQVLYSSKRRGYYRGIADLTRPLAKALRIRSRGRVVIYRHEYLKRRIIEPTTELIAQR